MNKNIFDKAKIAVVYGGASNEREVSIKSKDAICKALDIAKKGYVAIELSKNLPKDLYNNNINLVINAMHGKYGEDGRLPAMLDIMQIPYTHSGVDASYLALNKILSKQRIKKINSLLSDLKIPNYILIENIDNIPKTDLLNKPFILKPVSEGSSIGVELCIEPQKFTFKEEYFAYGPVIIEEYIQGKEVNVVVVNNKAIGVIEVKARSSFYDYNAKYNSKDTEYILDPQIEANLLDKILLCAEIIHNNFNCNYLSRSEFIVKDKDIYFLELNTHPGFTENSLVPKVAKKNNMEFIDVLKGLVDNAKYSI